MNDRINSILNVLQLKYPHASIALHYTSSWELLVAVILSAQCTDIRVNIVTNKLFKKYTTLDAYCHVTQEVFENDIKSTGFFRAKAKNILASARIIKEKYHGYVPKTMEEILTLPGVARKTANVVLGNAYGIVEGIAVDTHVLRISQRLQIIPSHSTGGKKRMECTKNGNRILDYMKDADPVKVEQALMRVIPKDQWFSITYRIIDHGRKICKAQKPDCTGCPLAQLCPVSRI